MWHFYKAGILIVFVFEEINMETKFKISWSNQVKFLTGIVFLVVGVVIYLLKDRIIAGDLLLVGVFSFVILILLYFFLQSPKNLYLTESVIIVEKISGKFKINYNDIQSIRAFTLDCTNIRLIGSGGFAGYIGLFRNKEIGKFHSYVGNEKQAFLIQLKNNANYVISCDNPDQVIKTINEFLRRHPA